jgi:hypothetical protein
VRRVELARSAYPCEIGWRTSHTWLAAASFRSVVRLRHPRSIRITPSGEVSRLYRQDEFMRLDAEQRHSAPPIAKQYALSAPHDRRCSRG